ncbi:MAG: 3'-5' exonuclease [Saprospiraceae bacterium]|nr:3'-5' exonuclease [Saprospiraceae bacterium]
MLDQIDIANVLFLDIETVPGQPDYEELDDEMRELWYTKSRSITRKSEDELAEEEAAALYFERAGIFAEFGKIICISVGIVHRSREDNRLRLRLKSFAGEDETEVLQEFTKLINQYYYDTNKNYLCGHNIKEFDIPYICRRMIVNQLDFPDPLNIAGKKPWETKHLLDTLELWKFGDNKNFTSLRLLAALLGFPSPKDDMDGSQVGSVFWEEKDLERIAHYCEKDVLATVQLFLRYRRMPLLQEDQVQHIK